jgi:hypothetical protein
MFPVENGFRSPLSGRAMEMKNRKASCQALDGRREFDIGVRLDGS